MSSFWYENLAFCSVTALSFCPQIPFPSVTMCFELLSYGNFSYSKYHIIKEQLENGEITVEDISEHE